MAVSVIITLDLELSEQEISRVVAAIRQLKGVATIEVSPAEMTGRISKARVKDALRESLHNVLTKAKS